MKELLIRTISGAVLVAVIVACILISPWTCWALALFIVAMGTFEMCRLMHVENGWLFAFAELMAVCPFVLVSLGMLQVLPLMGLLLLFPALPFLYALFSTTSDFKTVAACTFGSIAWLSVPCVLMMWMRENFGPNMLLLVFVLLWVNDTFAYLTGRLLGKHKLFERISPGKTIEGSIGGLVFTLAGVAVFSHYVSWLPLKVALGMGLIAVTFGTLGDLCESMLKRQAGVKDSGKLIPGHGGVLDRFDSVLFTLPFVFVFLIFLLLV